MFHARFWRMGILYIVIIYIYIVSPWSQCKRPRGFEEEDENVKSSLMILSTTALIHVYKSEKFFWYSKTGVLILIHITHKSYFEYHTAHYVLSISILVFLGAVFSTNNITNMRIVCINFRLMVMIIPENMKVTLFLVGPMLYKDNFHKMSKLFNFSSCWYNGSNLSKRSQSQAVKDSSLFWWRVKML